MNLAFAFVLLSAGIAAAQPAWQYEVKANEGAHELRVEATIAAGDSQELSVDDGAEPFVHDVELREASGWRPVAAKGTSWFIPPCAARGCRVRYRFALADAAEHLQNDGAVRYGTTMQAPPSTWLLHPLHPRSGRSYRFHVTTTGDVRFVSGVRTAGADSYEADVSLLPEAPYSAFGRFEVRRLQRKRGVVDVAFAPAQRLLSNDEIVHWLERGADAVEAYYGRFPIDRVLVLVLPAAGNEAHGHTLGNGGATMMLMVGARMTREATERDWVATHEMVHLAFPTLPQEQLWIAEGLATYIEPIARAELGQISVEKVWRDLVEGLPQGQPERGDRGLDHTQTWGRIYWGGAMFALLADVEIRERSGNRKGLVDAMRALVDAGDNLSKPMTLDEALRVGDAATGVPVLVRLRERLGEHAERIDLTALWRRLGVVVEGHHVRFDDGAPLAAVRRAITSH